MEMAICSRNLSIGIYSWAPVEFIDIKDNVIVGFMGKIYDNLMVHKGKRNCKFKPVYFFKEDQQQNESMKLFGADYLMRKNQMDFYSRPKPIGYVKSYLEITKTASVDL